MADNRLRSCIRRHYYGARRAAAHARNSFLDGSPKLLVLVYHRILKETGPNMLNTVVTEKGFVRQIDGIARRIPVITLSDAASQLKQARAKARVQAVISFDDGYSDNYDTALRILRQKGIPAVFFVPTGYVGAGCPLWDAEVIQRITDGRIGRIDTAGYSAARGKVESGEAFAFRVFDDLKSKSFRVIEDTVEYLRKISPSTPAGGGRCMTWDEVRRAAECGIEIGSHAVTHRSLARIPSAEALSEITESKAAVENNTGKPCVHFAFPFGSRRDYDGSLVDAVRRAGYETCMLNIHGYNSVDRGQFALKRIIMEEHTDTRFMLG